MFPRRTDDTASALRQAIYELGAKWAVNPARPRIAASTLQAWNELLAAWVRDGRLPLLVRKFRSDRGSLIAGAAGRMLIPTDNSPAQWAFAVAHSGHCPRVEDVLWLLGTL